MQDALQIKEKILRFIRLRGPSLPVHIAKETGLSILFASAFLSDLYSEKEIGISEMKVGSSPLYFIPGQEPQLENFSQYLKSKEKEAFLILKEKKFLKDSELQPAIRVALREIKDFAIPFQKEEEIYWRYFTSLEEEFDSTNEKQIEKSPEKIIEEVELKNEKKIENIFSENEKTEEISETELAHPKEKTEINPKPKKEKPKQNKPKKTKKQDENFFNKIKEFLEKRNTEILDIKDFKNNEAVFKIKREEEEELLFVFNQKKISEKEILKSHKKALESKMKYSILSLAETPKRLKDLMEALKDLSEIEKIE